jgi:hypothetical protein
MDKKDEIEQIIEACQAQIRELKDLVGVLIMIQMEVNDQIEGEHDTTH